MNRFGDRYVKVGGHNIPAHMLQAYNFVVQWSYGHSRLMLTWLYRIGELWHHDMTSNQIAEQAAYDILHFCHDVLLVSDKNRGGISRELMLLSSVVNHLRDLKSMNE